jgi:hypothetical protein
MPYGAKLQFCFLSSNFWGCALFSFISVEVLFLVLRVGRLFSASGGCLCYPCNNIQLGGGYVYIYIYITTSVI